jgi:amino acid permease
MEPEETSAEIELRQRHRKRRAFWKRRQFWIAVFAALVAMLIAIWLIGNLGSTNREVG